MLVSIGFHCSSGGYLLFISELEPKTIALYALQRETPPISPSSTVGLIWFFYMLRAVIWSTNWPFGFWLSSSVWDFLGLQYFWKNCVRGRQSRWPIQLLFTIGSALILVGMFTQVSSSLWTVEIGFGTILHRLKFWVHFLPIFRSSMFLVHRGYFNRWRVVF